MEFYAMHTTIKLTARQTNRNQATHLQQAAGLLEIALKNSAEVIAVVITSASDTLHWTSSLCLQA